DAVMAAQTEAMPPSAREIARLEESFRLFTRTTQDLESSYKRLTQRAARIDTELAGANRRLHTQVEELERVTRNQRGTLDALPVGVVVMDASGTLIDVNRAAEHMIGRQRDELVGRSRAVIVGPTGDALLTDRDTPDEREVVALDGSKRRLAWSSASLPDGHEVQVLTDRTVATRLREQVSRLDTLAALGEMAAGVAHEIRNPLNGIEGFAALLERAVSKGVTDAGLTRYADNIRRGVREVNTIISNLLTFASPDSIRSGRVDLSALLQGIIDEVRGSHATAKTIRGHFPREGCEDVPGDAIKLKIVFVNLIKNAVEAAGIEGHVDVLLELSERSFLVTVRDDGPGLAPTMRDKLFRPFSTDKPDGTGLGLAIANKLVSLHGGGIEALEAAQGCTFRVTLPRGETPR
ncbi:MAG: PAS domain S-box protein, partial [Planctomycetes bacterium]|nr:PAS domain S-box protein [Planctomycetota bacterium]